MIRNIINYVIDVKGNMKETAASAKDVNSNMAAATVSATKLSDLAKRSSAGGMFGGPLGQGAGGTGLGRGTAARGDRGQARDFAREAQGLGGLVRIYATFAANIYAVSTALGVLQKAIDVERMVKSLDYLATKTGQDLKGLAKDLRTISGEALSVADSIQFTSMAAASNIASRDIKQLTVIAKGASAALGRDMTDALSRLTRGVVKLEPELLDELGILTKAGQAYKEYARIIGVSAEELTGVQKQQAYLNAVLKEGTEKWAELAQAVPANPYAKLTAATKSAVQDVLETVNAILGPIVNLIAESQSLVTAAIVGIGAKLLSVAVPAFTNYQQRILQESRELNKELATERLAAFSKVNGAIVAEHAALVAKIAANEKTLAASTLAIAQDNLKKSYNTPNTAGVKLAMEAKSIEELKNNQHALNLFKNQQERIEKELLAAQTRKAALMGPMTEAETQKLAKLEAQNVAIRQANELLTGQIAKVSSLNNLNDKIIADKQKELALTSQINQSIAAPTSRELSLERKLGTAAALSGLNLTRDSIGQTYKELKRVNVEAIATTTIMGPRMVGALTTTRAAASLTLGVLSQLGTRLLALLTGPIGIAATLVMALWDPIANMIGLTTKKTEELKGKMEELAESANLVGDTFDRAGKKLQAMSIAAPLEKQADVIADYFSSGTSAVLDKLNSIEEGMQAIKAVRDEIAKDGDFWGTKGKSVRSAEGTVARELNSLVATVSSTAIEAPLVEVFNRLETTAFTNLREIGDAFNSLADEGVKGAYIDSLRTAIEATKALGQAGKEGIGNAEQLLKDFAVNVDKYYNKQDFGKIDTRFRGIAEALSDITIKAQQLNAQTGNKTQTATIISQQMKTTLSIAEEFLANDRIVAKLGVERVKELENEVNKLKLINEQENIRLKALVSQKALQDETGKANREALLQAQQAYDAAPNTSTLNMLKKAQDRLKGTTTDSTKAADTTVKNIASVTEALVEALKLATPSAGAMKVARDSTREMELQVKAAKALAEVTSKNLETFNKLGGTSSTLVDKWYEQERAAASLENTLNRQRVANDKNLTSAERTLAIREAESIEASKLAEIEQKLADIANRNAFAFREAELKNFNDKLKIAEMLLSAQVKLGKLSQDEASTLKEGAAIQQSYLESRIKAEKEIDLLERSKSAQAAAGNLTEDEKALYDVRIQGAKFQLAEMTKVTEEAKKAFIVEKARNSLYNALNTSISAQDTILSAATSKMITANEGIAASNQLVLHYTNKINMETQARLAAEGLTTDSLQGQAVVMQGQLELANKIVEVEAARLEIQKQSSGFSPTLLGDELNSRLSELQKSVPTITDSIADAMFNSIDAGIDTIFDKLKQGAEVSLRDIGKAVSDTIKGTILDAVSSRLKQSIKEGLVDTLFGPQQSPLEMALETATKGIAESNDKLAVTLTAVGEVIGSAIDKFIAALPSTAGGGVPKFDTPKVIGPEVKSTEEETQISMYQKMTKAAQGFFNAKSKGYKAMNSLSKAFAMQEVAITAATVGKNIASFAKQTIAFVLGRETQTATTLASVGPEVAAATAKGQANAVAGVANQANGDPYTAFGRMAAMAAIMAALGLAVGGFGSKGGGGMSAQERQAATGTGTVLGDSSAQSESIANSLEILQNNSIADLTYSQGMLKALLSIDSAIRGVSNVLARSNLDEVGAAAGITTGFSQNIIGKVLGFAGKISPTILVGDVVGKLLGKLFGSKTTITDEGIFGGPQSFGEIAATGFKGQSYADVETKKKFFGLTTSTKNSTTFGTLPQDVQTQFGLVIESLGKGVQAAAEAIGLNGDQVLATLNSFIIDIGKLSLKGLSSEQVQKQLEALFGRIGDQLAGAAVPGLLEFQQAGEGLFETLIRVANEIQATDTILSIMGLDSKTAFGTVGMASVAAREHLIELAGGLEELSNKTTYFYNNFLTDSDRLTIVSKSLETQYKALGIAIPKTAAEFKNLLTSQNLATEAGREQYATLLNLAEIQKVYLDGLEAQKEALEDLIESITGFTREGTGKSLMDAIFNAETAKQAGENFAANFQESFANSMTDLITQQVGSMIYDQIITPLIQASVQQASIMQAGAVTASTELQVGAAIAAVDIASVVSGVENYLNIMAAILDDPKVKESLAKITETFKKVGETTYNAIGAMELLAKKTETANRAITNINDQLFKLGKTSVHLEIVSIFKELRENLEAGAGALSNALSSAKITELGITTLKSYTGLIGKTSESLAITVFESMKKDFDKVFDIGGGGKVWLPDQVGGKPVTSEELLQDPLKYWESLTDIGKQALLIAMSYRADYINAVKAQFDQQLSVVNKWASRMESVNKFVSNLGKDIDKYKLQAGIMSRTEYLSNLDTSIASSLGKIREMILVDPENTDDIIAKAEEYKSLLVERYDYEIESQRELLDFAKSIKDYLQNLRLSEKSILTPAEKLSESLGNFRGLLNTLKDPTATPEAIKDARDKITSSADVLLELGKSYFGSGTGYQEIFNEVTSGLAQFSQGSVDQTELMKQSNESLKTLIDKLTELKTGAEFYNNSTLKPRLDEAVILLRSSLSVLENLAPELAALLDDKFIDRGPENKVKAAIDAGDFVTAFKEAKTLDTATFQKILKDKFSADTTAEYAGILNYGRQTGAELNPEWFRPVISSLVSEFTKSGMTPQNYFADKALVQRNFSDMVGRFGFGMDQLKQTYTSALGMSWSDIRSKLMESGVTQFPSYDVGSNFIQGDQVAKVHHGERIFTAVQNERIVAAMEGNNEMVVAINKLSAQVAELRKANEEQAYMIAKSAHASNQQSAKAISSEVSSAVSKTAEINKANEKANKVV